MAKKTPPTKTGSVADQIRLGSDVAAVKANTRPNIWKQIVRQAHARGFTVAGVLSGQPDALKERTKSSLKTQAMKTVADAYAPSLEDNSRLADRVRALDAKRQSDNAFYNQWLM